MKMKLVKVKKSDTVAYQNFAKQCRDLAAKINGLALQRDLDIGKMTMQEIDMARSEARRVYKAAQDLLW